MNSKGNHYNSLFIFLLITIPLVIIGLILALIFLIKKRNDDSTITSTPTTPSPITPAPTTPSPTTPAPTTPSPTTPAPTTPSPTTPAPTTPAPTTPSPTTPAPTTPAPTTPSPPKKGNPFYPIENVYVQPSLAENINNALQYVSEQSAKEELNKMKAQPSAFWIDNFTKISATENILKDMKDGQSVVFIVYDLPNRDCMAISSNGEICCNTDPHCQQDATKGTYCTTDCQKNAKNCDEAISTYRTKYIDALSNLFKKYPNVNLILIIEPDSIPNCVTNVGQNGCTDVTCQAYTDGVTYALKTFSALSNVTMYLDAGHGGWLGWDNNLTIYKQIITENNWCQYIRGFATNTANYQQLGPSPCDFDLNATDYNSFKNAVDANKGKNECGYDPCDLSTPYNAATSELNYVQLLYWKFQDQTFKDGKPYFVIDTGRNGNPEARLGQEACKVWCNVNNARVGEFPTTDTAIDMVDAYFWLKTPGESDGCIDFNVQGKCDNSDRFGSSCVRYDTNCGTHEQNIGYTSDQPCPPEAGQWFDYQIQMLAGASTPVQPTGTPGPSTPSPTTPGPSTPSPTTPGPSTPSPTTPGPSTPSPTTPGPSTPSPSDVCKGGFGACKQHTACKNWSDSKGCGIVAYNDTNKQEGGYYAKPGDELSGNPGSTLNETYGSYACVDWSFQSKRMQNAEKTFLDNTGHDVYFGVGTYGSQQNGLGKCFLIDVSGVDKSLIVQAINTGSDVQGNQFDLQTGDGGFGAFDACAGDANVSMYYDPDDPDGTNWGAILGGVSKKEDCTKLPKYPKLWGDNPPDYIDNLQDLCTVGFDKGIRLEEGNSNPTITNICNVSCPPELTSITGMVPKNPGTQYTCKNTPQPTGNVCSGGNDLSWCLTRMMDCRKPSGAGVDNVNLDDFEDGQKIVQACGQDGYNRIDNRCGCYPNSNTGSCDC